LAATPTVSRGVHDSRAEHWCIATKRPAALSCARCDTVHTHSTAGTCATGSGWVCALPKPPSSFTGRASRLLQRVQRETSHTRRCWCRRARARAREALPVVVLMRGGGRRCTLSVDARVVSRRGCWRKQEMGWPVREGWCLGCGWDVVVVVYVGVTVHARASQLQAPTHRPPRLRSDVMRNEYSSGSLARSGTH
jgi:hypothetical protein